MVSLTRVSFVEIVCQIYNALDRLMRNSCKIVQTVIYYSDNGICQA